MIRLLYQIRWCRQCLIPNLSRRIIRILQHVHPVLAQMVDCSVLIRFVVLCWRVSDVCFCVLARNICGNVVRFLKYHTSIGIILTNKGNIRPYCTQIWIVFAPWPSKCNYWVCNTSEHLKCARLTKDYRAPLSYYSENDNSFILNRLAGIYCNVHS